MVISCHSCQWLPIPFSPSHLKWFRVDRVIQWFMKHYILEISSNHIWWLALPPFLLRAIPKSASTWAVNVRNRQSALWQINIVAENPPCEQKENIHAGIAFMLYLLAACLPRSIHRKKNEAHQLKWNKCMHIIITDDYYYNVAILCLVPCIAPPITVRRWHATTIGHSQRQFCSQRIVSLHFQTLNVMICICIKM